MGLLSVTELPAEQHLQMLQILVHLLPTANVVLLKHLLGLLRRVCDQKETRMTAVSLGRLFAPHLLISRGVGPHFSDAGLLNAEEVPLEQFQGFSRNWDHRLADSDRLNVDLLAEVILVISTMKIIQ